LEDVVLDVQRDGALLEVGLHPVLVTGVGVDDVPLAGQAAQLLAELLDRVALVLRLLTGGFLARLALGGLGLGSLGLLGAGLVRGGVRSLGLVRGRGVLAVRALGSLELVLDDDLGPLAARLDGVVHVRVRHGGCFFLDTEGWNTRKGRRVPRRPSLSAQPKTYLAALLRP